MTAILDPTYSLPIDLHLWSDHPELDTLVTTIWAAYFADMEGAKPGPKPRTPVKDQLKLALVNCYAVWLEDPELSIGVSMNVNAYDTRSRYNALSISKHFIQVLRRLVDAGLLVMAKGSYAGPGAGGNRTSRIRPSDRLKNVFAQTRATRDDLYRIETEETVILRDAKNHLQEYEDTAQTTRWREELRAYNRVLAGCCIDLSTAESSLFVDGDRVLGLGRSYQFVRRVFSRGRWSCNSRFYGGWWQGLGAEHRGGFWPSPLRTARFR